MTAGRRRRSRDEYATIRATHRPPAPVWLTTAADIAAGAVSLRALTTRVPERAARRMVLLHALAGVKSSVG